MIDFTTIYKKRESKPNKNTFYGKFPLDWILFLNTYEVSDPKHKFRAELKLPIKWIKPISFFGFNSIDHFYYLASIIPEDDRILLDNRLVQITTEGNIYISLANETFGFYYYYDQLNLIEVATSFSDLHSKINLVI